MTEIEKDELISKAQPFIGKTLMIKGVAYTFKQTGFIGSRTNDKPGQHFNYPKPYTFEVYGILISENGKFEKRSLEKLLLEFETQSGNNP